MTEYITMPWIDSCDFNLYYIPNEAIVDRAWLHGNPQQQCAHAKGCRIIRQTKVEGENQEGGCQASLAISCSIEEVLPSRINFTSLSEKLDGIGMGSSPSN